MANILVVDDSVAIRSLISTILDKCGHNIFLANDGTQGISMAKWHQPDIVITDIIMPNVDGFEFIQQLLRLNISTKIIAISGSMSSYTDIALETAKLFGTFGTLRKPISENDLLKLVNLALST